MKPEQIKDEINKLGISEKLILVEGKMKLRYTDRAKDDVDLGFEFLDCVGIVGATCFFTRSCTFNYATFFYHSRESRNPIKHASGEAGYPLIRKEYAPI